MTKFVDKFWYCPRGHKQHYVGKTEAQKLKERLQQKQRQLEAEAGRAHMLEQQRNDIQRTYSRVRERIKNGVCPCCSRSFENLRRHMETKHPEFGSDGILKTIRTSYGLTQTSLAEEIGIPSPYISSFENKKHIPEYAKSAIESWMEFNS